MNELVEVIVAVTLALELLDALTLGEGVMLSLPEFEALDEVEGVILALGELEEVLLPLGVCEGD